LLQINKRWRKAQKAEARAWEKQTETSYLTEHVQNENIERMCRYTSFSAKELENMKILEIGGPVVERAFDNPMLPVKIILDPLLPFKRFIGHNDKCCIRVRAMGEYLPIADNSIDLCWCANTIDHTMLPNVVFSETRRILNHNGTYVVSSHLFPNWMKPFFPILHIIDSPHPHHFTYGYFQLLLKQNFTICNVFEVEWPRVRFTLRSLKSNIAKFGGVKELYFICKPIK
jgi:SAM-dependent methyltransferase